MARYFQTFMVNGIGTFPFDMLRYDYCYPSDTEDALNLIEDYNELTNERRTVRLSRQVDRKDIQPTLARWLSFGWTVDSNSIRMHKL